MNRTWSTEEPFERAPAACAVGRVRPLVAIGLGDRGLGELELADAAVLLIDRTPEVPGNAGMMIVLLERRHGECLDHAERIIDGRAFWRAAHAEMPLRADLTIGTREPSVVER